MDLGHIPSFCTACYREGRTGDRFMTLVKSGQIANCCAPNALMTLKEYLEDYASDEVKAKGEVLIKQELEKIPNPVVKQKATEYIENIHEGKRDFRFQEIFMFKHLNTRIPKRIEQEKDKVSAVMIPLIKKNDANNILFEVIYNKK